jgi:thiol:disulfide interchange protein
MAPPRRPTDVRPAPRSFRESPPGSRVGAISLNPTGVVFVIALIGSVAYLFYAFTVRDASQIPLLASGAAVLGFVFGAFSIIGLVATWRSSIHGRDGRAFGHALVGGISALVAAGCCAAAIILGILASSP